jgi:signal transduction histidine kinase
VTRAKDEASGEAMRSDSGVMQVSSAVQSPVEALLAALPDAIVVVSRSGIVRYANPAALELFGEHESNLVGHRFRYPTLEGSPLAIKVQGPDGPRFAEMRVVRYDWYGEASLIASIRDLTEQRRAEDALRRVEEQVRHKQRLEAIGSLAGGVAHDFNNLLSVVLSYANLALETLSEDDPLKEDMLEVRKASERASDLTRQLLAFSRRQIMVPRVIDLNEVVRGMEKMLGRMLAGSAELAVLLSSDLGKVVADPGQVEQIIMNLVVNARDAMPGGGRITVETANAELDEAYAAEHDVIAGSYSVISVLDTGKGMDAPTIARVFEPFFTTKEHGKGTGLGLSVVYGIVQQMAGHVRVYSQPGTGTMFRVYFPRTTDADEPASPSHAPQALPPRGTETVLLVEDDDQVRGLVRTVLRRNGYEVLEAGNAGEALLVSDKFGGEIHLLLTDVVMPRVGGHELAKRMVTTRPSIKVLYMSGYRDDATPLDGELGPGRGFLQKPITPESLLRKVRGLLDATGSALAN